jgi:hypothetical protein
MALSAGQIHSRNRPASGTAKISENGHFLKSIRLFCKNSSHQYLRPQDNRPFSERPGVSHVELPGTHGSWLTTSNSNFEGVRQKSAGDRLRKNVSLPIFSQFQK